jgi:hypothetical protein
MTAGRTVARILMERLICAGLLAVLLLPVAGLIAFSLEDHSKCDCGCPQDGANPCCCKRARAKRGPMFEAADTCCGDRNSTSTPMQARSGRMLPPANATRAGAPAMTALASISDPAAPSPDNEFPCFLYERPPPVA